MSIDKKCCLSIILFLTVFSILSLVSGCTAEQQRSGLINPKIGYASTAGARKTDQVEDERQIVQESSQRIAVLVRRRPATITPNAKQRLIQQDIDNKIIEIQRERTQALESVMLADNPAIQSVDPQRGIYHVPIANGRGQLQWFSGRIPAVWHLNHLDPAVFTLAESIRSRPQSVNLPSETLVTSHLLISGTSAQSMVHPYPGDIDYGELFVVHAQNPTAAGEAMAAIIAEFVSRSVNDPSLEFDILRVMPLRSRRSRGADYLWTRNRILDLSQRSELARQLAGLNNGRLNTDWRALVSDQRYIIIGKIFSIKAIDSVSGELFFATAPLHIDFQALYFGNTVPATHQDDSLGSYASIMKKRASIQDRRDKHLKAAKRVFNYCRAIGDIECMDSVIPIFASPEAKVYSNYKVLEAIAVALDPDTSSRILLATNARKQIRNVATAIEENLPVVPGTIPERPKAVADQLRDIASAIRARRTDPAGTVEPDPKLAKRLKTLMNVEIVSMVSLSLKDRVEKIVDTYIR